jgi:hypothetical protein
MSITGATHNHLPPGEDSVGNALSAFHSIQMGGPWEADLRDSIPSQGTAESLRQRSDTLMSQGFPSRPGIQNTSTYVNIVHPRPHRKRLMLQDPIPGDNIWQTLFRPYDIEDDVSVLPQRQQEYSYPRVAGFRIRYRWTSSPLVMSNPTFLGPELFEGLPCARSTTLQPTCPTDRVWSSFDKFRQTSVIRCTLFDIRLCSMARPLRTVKQLGIRSLVSALI